MALALVTKMQGIAMHRSALPGYYLFAQLPGHGLWLYLNELICGKLTREHTYRARLSVINEVVILHRPSLTLFREAHELPWWWWCLSSSTLYSTPRPTGRLLSYLHGKFFSGIPDTLLPT